MNAAAARHLVDRAARLARWGRAKEAAEAYREACAGPLEASALYPALLGLAGSLDALGQYDGAIAACRQAICCAPDQSAAHGVLALSLMHQGALDEAAAVAAQASRCEDGGSAMLCLLASIELRRGRPGPSLTAVAAVLQREPGNTRARALQRLGEWYHDRDSAWFDWSILVRVSRPQAPADFASIAAFNAELVAALCEECTGQPAAPGGPLVNGDRLDDIFSLDPRLATAMRALFVGEADHYAKTFALDDGDLLSGVSPTAFAVRGWGNVMKPGAFELPHIHEQGRLSCVYYPELPGAGSVGGEIVFGPHDLGPLVPAPSPFTLAPGIGQMIIFPSDLYHSTRPFSGPGRRISIAADIVASSP